MFTKVLAVIGVIKELIALIKLFYGWIEAQKRAEAEKRTQEREKALEEIVKAETEEEFDAAQDRVVDNRSQP